jgi:ribosomal-protein-alanine N-acetyltransferase
MIKLRLQEVSDAERFFNILNNPNFVNFDVQPTSIKDEIAWLELNPERQKNNTQWNYTILFGNEIIGAIGVQINYHRQYIGEIGYFIDEKYWNKGIATQAVKLIENICINQLNLTRIEISIPVGHAASEKVGIKNNYTKEGTQRQLIKGKDGKMHDCYLYAKII